MISTRSAAPVVARLLRRWASSRPVRPVHAVAATAWLVVSAWGILLASPGQVGQQYGAAVLAMAAAFPLAVAGGEWLLDRRNPGRAAR